MQYVGIVRQPERISLMKNLEYFLLARGLFFTRWSGSIVIAAPSPSSRLSVLSPAVEVTRYNGVTIHKKIGVNETDAPPESTEPETQNKLVVTMILTCYSLPHI